MKRKPLQRFLRMKLKTYMLAGFLVIGPVALTMMVLQWLVTSVDRALYRFLPHSLQPEQLIGVHIPGLGLLVSLVCIFIVGILTANYLGQRLIRGFEYLVYRIPLVRFIYSLFKQLADSTLGKDRRGFNRVVLIEYPRRAIWSIGFVTGIAEGEVQEKTTRKVINIFIPTTPNPTSGFYIMVPEEDAIPLSMTVDDAFKMVISGGLFSPESRK